jgi:hypothetical protein
VKISHKPNDLCGGIANKTLVLNQHKITTIIYLGVHLQIKTAIPFMDLGVDKDAPLLRALALKSNASGVETPKNIWTLYPPA